MGTNSAELALQPPTVLPGAGYLTSLSCSCLRCEMEVHATSQSGFRWKAVCEVVTKRLALFKSTQ